MALLFRIGGGSDQTTTGFQRARTTAGRHPPMMWCVFTVSFWVGGWLGGGRGGTSCRCRSLMRYCWLIKTGTAIYRRRDTSLRSAALPFRRRLSQPTAAATDPFSTLPCCSLSVCPDRLFGLF